MNDTTASTKKIFLVDDDLTNLMVGKKALAGVYEVFTFSSAKHLLSALEKVIPDLILLDVAMPDKNGYETIIDLKANDRTKDIPVIFLTAQSDNENELRGLSLGAIDYIVKPFSRPLLLKRIEMHILINDQKEELRYQKEELARFNSQLQQMVEMRTKTVLELRDALLCTMAELVESRDDVTGGHIERVQLYVGVLVEAMRDHEKYKNDVAKWDIKLVLQSSLLHDVGKISIKDSILNKPGKLTDEEFEEMKKHTTFGGDVIGKIKVSSGEKRFLEYAQTFALTHHERWDGRGYPNGLKQTDIPLLGRVMAIPDVYDALRSERPYKKAFTHDEAVKIITDGRGTQFDPDLIDLFVSVEDKFDRIASSISTMK